MTHWLIHPPLQSSGGHCRFKSHTGAWSGASCCGEWKGGAVLQEVLPIGGGKRFLIRYPCWQLFQRGINYTTANSSLVETPLSSMSLSRGWFCWYFGGGLCAISFFLLLLVLSSFLFLVFIFLGDLVFWLLSLLAVKQVPAARGVCVPMSSCRITTQASGLDRSPLHCLAGLFLSPF